MIHSSTISYNNEGNNSQQQYFRKNTPHSKATKNQGSQNYDSSSQSNQDAYQLNQKSCQTEIQKPKKTKIIKINNQIIINSTVSKQTSAPYIHSQQISPKFQKNNFLSHNLSQHQQKQLQNPIVASKNQKEDLRTVLGGLVSSNLDYEETCKQAYMYQKLSAVQIKKYDSLIVQNALKKKFLTTYNKEFQSSVTSHQQTLHNSHISEQNDHQQKQKEDHFNIHNYLPPATQASRFQSETNRQLHSKIQQQDSSNMQLIMNSTCSFSDIRKKYSKKKLLTDIPKIDFQQYRREEEELLGWMKQNDKKKDLNAIDMIKLDKSVKSFIERKNTSNTSRPATMQNQYQHQLPTTKRLTNYNQSQSSILQRLNNLNNNYYLEKINSQAKPQIKGSNIPSQTSRMSSRFENDTQALFTASKSDPQMQSLFYILQMKKIKYKINKKDKQKFQELYISTIDKLQQFKQYREENIYDDFIKKHKLDSIKYQSQLETDESNYNLINLLEKEKLKPVNQNNNNNKGVTQEQQINPKATTVDNENFNRLAEQEKSYLLEYNQKKIDFKQLENPFAITKPIICSLLIDKQQQKGPRNNLQETKKDQDKNNKEENDNDNLDQQNNTQDQIERSDRFSSQKNMQEANKNSQININHLTYLESVELQKLKNLQEKKVKFKRIQESLLLFLRKIWELNLTLSELIEEKLFTGKPFQRQYTEILFETIKNGDFSKVELILIKDKYLIYDVDQAQCTALHWAAKRGDINIAKILIKHQADVDARDMLGRTPLFFAYRSQNFDLAKLLLIHKALPWSTQKNDFNPYLQEMNLDKQRLFLRTVRQVHLRLMLTKYAQRPKVWEENYTQLIN